MEKSNRKNLSTYYRYMPLTGLITSILVFIMFYFIFQIQDNILVIMLYSSLPFFIYSFISIINKIGK
ncbi:Doubtful CDS [Mammaliicoccus stepanovicii]|uniref:Doubtful CDS n=1 Tax=Mammaliicoccus stepanovicii TaxID=643214 RepID=A0A239ZET7_9STAP|nr:Doubtful CDS [Mammaliicoccus stepanovicii]